MPSVTVEDPLVNTKKLPRHAYLNRINSPHKCLCVSLGSMAQVLLGEHRHLPSASPPHLRDGEALSSLGRRHHMCTQHRVSRNRTQTRGLCSLHAEAPLSPLLFCWARVGVVASNGHRALDSCHSLCSLSQTSSNRFPLSTSCPGCSVPEPSVPREHHVDFTRTRTGWVCTHSIPNVVASVVACCAACYHPTHQGSAASSQEQSRPHSSRSSPMALSHARNIPAAERAQLGAAHQVTYPSAAPVTPSKHCHPVAGPVGERQPAGQQLSLYSVELLCAVAPARLASGAPPPAPGGLASAHAHEHCREGFPSTQWQLGGCPSPPGSYGTFLGNLLVTVVYPGVS